ncbi:MAG TPA: helix-turn-helix domain-containing protein [Chryseosolibacter sp.]
MKKIAIICFDELLLSSVAGFVDAFKIANQLWIKDHHRARPLFSWTLASLDGKEIVASSGVTMKVDGKLPGSADIIFIPAWHFDGVKRLTQESERIASWCGSWISKQHRKNAIVAAGCSGSFILANTGLLRNKTITTSWWLNEYFRSFHPDVKLDSSQLILQDGRIFSAGPVNSHFNLAMKLIEKEAGHALALACAKTMLVDINRPSQVAYEIAPVQHKHSDEGVLLAQTWMSKNLQRSFDISEAAKAARMSPRTFIRHFKKAVGIPPVQYLQHLRIDLAKRLLETSDLTFDEIVSRVGYLNASSFRTLFKLETSLTPADYRKRFSR